MKNWKRVLGNAVIGFLIAFVVQLPTDALPDIFIIYRSFIGALLGFLFSLQILFKEPVVHNPPKKDRILPGVWF